MGIEAEFSPQNVPEVRFGASSGEVDNLRSVPTNADVRGVLVSILTNTIDCFVDIADADFASYSPSEKYASFDPVKLNRASDTVNLARINNLFQGCDNLVDDPTLLKEPEDMNFYFVNYKDANGRRCVGARRASQFKSTVGAGKRLIVMDGDYLKVVPTSVYKLDQIFDILICEENIYIIRPENFVFIGDIFSSVQAESIKAATALGERLTFLKVDWLKELVSKRKRAARLMTAIGSRAELLSVQKATLIELAGEVGITLVEDDGRLEPAVGDELRFLELLDDRLYVSRLLPAQPVRYLAQSRRPV